MTDEQRIDDTDRRLQLAQVHREHAPDLEARDALLGLIERAADEVRIGLLPLDVEEVSRLAAAYSWLIDGDTPSEAPREAAKA